MESAPLWQFVALLAGLNPDSVWRERNIDTIEWRGANENFHRLLRIAVSSVRANGLECLGYGSDTERNSVLTSEFVRWAHSKGLPIPPEWKLPETTGEQPARAASSMRVEGIAGLRNLIKELGLTLGDDAAVRSFAKRAGIMQSGENVKRKARFWDRAEIEPKVRAEVERRRQNRSK